MPFDPSLPADNSPIVAAELRAQFTALATRLDNLNARLDSFEGRISVPDFGMTVSDPPTYGEVQAIANALQETVATLRG